MKIMDIMKNSKGFTLIELIIVMIIIGILAAIITPKFISLESDARTAAEAGLRGAVKSAWAIAVGENQGFPTVTQLGEATQGGTAQADGILVEGGGGTQYVVQTWTGTGCAASGDSCALKTDPASGETCVQTTAVGQDVTCVGDITTV